MLNETHDPSLQSWVAAANEPDAAFPIQNLPFAVLKRVAREEPYRAAVAIGDQALDLQALRNVAIAPSSALDACQQPTLNRFMGLGRQARSDLRSDLSRLLAVGSAHREQLEPCLIPLAEVEYALPAAVGDYTDFYTSIHHAINIGRLFRPDNPLLPNYHWVPIGYHGRSSSIVVSGAGVRRPRGQLKPAGPEAPAVSACKRLDYELEVGIFVGPANELGEPVEMVDAEDHLFGLGLLNDWSARDVQAWEYQPLGPFLAKSFATSISPWIVTLDALAPFRSPWRRAADDPQPLAYLSSEQNAAAGAIDMQLEVSLITESMRSEGTPPERLSKSNLTDAYWTIAQLLTHHTMNGCNLQSGDLLGSGTMSGATEGSQGALIEITEGGQRPHTLANGETRTFLEDGDEVIMTARCMRDGFRSIGFGEVRGTVLPALVGKHTAG